MWAVGWWRPSFDSPKRALFQHWDGTQWHFAPAAGQGAGNNLLNASVQVSGTDGWAVGAYDDGSNSPRTLTMRLNPQTCGTTTVVPTATPTFTRTPAPTESSIATPAESATPMSTASPTTCSVAFTDVPDWNTFYPFVRCLACRGIVNGYPCGGDFEPCDPNNDPYFRPNNPVTRGQIAKIVSNSAGFGEEVPPERQTFTDVQYGSPFWVWIERLANREIMSGYPCGGPNEPCDPENRPYFHPNTGATRGQMTKIVSNGAGFNDTIPPDEQWFTDMPPGSTFWVYVQRLALNRPTVVIGYACGAPGEPCDDQARPYFRPHNPLTRGQSSKIAAGTFFPGCSALDR
jgi:hypothetical protein